MKRSKWEDERKERKKKALLEHERLYRLFTEDRLSFERERKKMIDDVINSAEFEEQRNRLRAIQESWDKKMRGAGSRHNRFVLAQAIFWKHFYEVWLPTIKKFDSFLR